MTLDQKKNTALLLQQYCGTFSSQAKAANSLVNVSEATIINVLNNRWEQVSDRMWMAIFNQIKKREQLVEPVETMLFSTLVLYYSIAREEGATFAFTAGGGSGKSFTAKSYSAANRANNVYYIECAHYFNRKQFLQQIMVSMGLNYYGMNLVELMEKIVGTLRQQKHPLIILDEVDKLSDNVLQFFITLYNELNGICGFIWQSTNNIEKRFTRGILRNATGYQELYSRIGRTFIELPRPDVKEIIAVAGAYGLDTTNRELMGEIVNESQGDLRRIERRLVKARSLKKLKNLNAA